MYKIYLIHNTLFAGYEQGKEREVYALKTVRVKDVLIGTVSALLITS